MRPCLKRGGSAAARLPLALLVAAHSALASTAADPADPPPPTTPTNRTVMAWIAGNSTTSLRFILHGAAKGTVNAVSAGGMFGFATNKTDAWLTVDAQAVAAHRRVWQQGEAKAAGLRTYPSMNLNWDIVDEWRPWMTNGQVSGYVERYDGLDFVTVKGVGHMAPQWARKPVTDMINSWMHEATIP